MPTTLFRVMQGFRRCSQHNILVSVSFCSGRQHSCTHVGKRFNIFVRTQTS